MPYYGRDWSVNNETAPAQTTGSSFAVTYKNYRNNIVDYNWSTEHFEPNSQSVYYSYELSGRRQCFIDDAKRLGQKYDLVNRSALGGIGIWALGYDNGYSDLWDVIRDKFSNCAPPLCSDTLYDSGGPAFNYKQDEDYTQTLAIGSGQTLTVDLLEFNTEAGADSLLFYDGSNTSAPLLAAYSGTQSPVTLFPTGNSIAFHFKANSATQKSGYKFVYKCPSAGENEIFTTENDFTIYPNPNSGTFTLTNNKLVNSAVFATITDISGKVILKTEFDFAKENKIIVNLDTNIEPGIYFLTLQQKNKLPQMKKLVIQ